MLPLAMLVFYVWVPRPATPHRPVPHTFPIEEGWFETDQSACIADVLKWADMRRSVDIERNLPPFVHWGNPERLPFYAEDEEDGEMAVCESTEGLPEEIITAVANQEVTPDVHPPSWPTDQAAPVAVK